MALTVIMLAVPCICRCLGIFYCTIVHCSDQSSNLDVNLLALIGCEQLGLMQGRFVMFADEMRPGRTFWRDDIFDITQTADGPFYNVPGYLDNFKVLLFARR